MENEKNLEKFLLSEYNYTYAAINCDPRVHPKLAAKLGSDGQVVVAHAFIPNRQTSVSSRTQPGLQSEFRDSQNCYTNPVSKQKHLAVSSTQYWFGRQQSIKGSDLPDGFRAVEARQCVAGKGLSKTLSGTHRTPRPSVHS